MFCIYMMQYFGCNVNRRLTKQNKTKSIRHMDPEDIDVHNKKYRKCFLLPFRQIW